MQKNNGLTILKVMVITFFVVLFAGCTKEKDLQNPPAYTPHDEVNMKPLINGDSVANKSISKSIGVNESLLSQTIATGITTNATKVYEISASTITSSYSQKTLRIEVEIAGSGDGSITLYQSLTGGGATTQKIETNSTPKASVSNQKSLFLSASRLSANAGKAYIMFNNNITSGPVSALTLTIRVYQENSTFTLQKWTNLRDYIHFKQGNNSTIGATACGHNTYMLARHMAKPDIFGVSSSGITSLHNRLKVISSYTNFAYLHYLEALGNGRLYNFGGYQDGICGGSSSNGRRGDLGRENVTEYQNNVNDYKFWSQLKTTSNTATGRNDIKQFLEQSLSDGKYIIIPIKVSDSNIVASGGIGHFILLVGIDKTSTGVGSYVYYKDGLTDNSETQCVDYTTLLDSNNANTGGYQVMSVGWYKPACW